MTGNNTVVTTEPPQGDENSNNSGIIAVSSSSDSYPGQAVIYRLDDTNYLHWSSSVRIFISGRGKAGYLLRTTKKLAETDPNFEQWDNNDHLVRGWLISTMIPKIGEIYLLHPSAKSIWDHAKKTYSTVDNSSALLEIETKLYDLKQGSMSVNDYYNSLSHYWMQLDGYETQDWKDPDDGELCRKFVNKKRTLHFLLGLNHDLDDVRGRVMATKPFPELEEAVSEVRREELRRHVMLSETKAVTNVSALKSEAPVATALVGNKQNHNKQKEIATVYPPITKYCDHCKVYFHDKFDCWYLNGGKPPNWMSARDKHAAAAKPRANAATNEAQFSNSQLEAIRKMLAEVIASGQSSKPKTPDVSFSSFAQGGGIGEDDWRC
ncbi:hypothetical protein LINGRAHAP2_LOCUS15732 [Linum grandiflorum]